MKKIVMKRITKHSMEKKDFFCRTYSVSAKNRINSFVLLSTFRNFAAGNI